MTSPADLAEIITAVDAANAADPTTVVVDGVARPKELVHAERMTHWLGRLVADPTVAQQIAARAHHLRRWESPRSAYPDGRAGYLQWRTAARKRHVADIRRLLDERGCPSGVVDDVARIVAKEARTTHADVQAHEDALCLTFCELQLDELLGRLGHDHTVTVVRKTLSKMSDAAISLAAEVEMSAAARSALAEAVAGA